MNKEEITIQRKDLIKKEVPIKRPHRIATGIFRKIVEIPIGILKKRFRIIEIPEKPVIGKPAERAKLWTASAIRMLPMTSNRMSIPISGQFLFLL